MENAKCDVFYCNRGNVCITKVLECGHAICLRCLEGKSKDNFRDQKFCPKCRKTLLKSLGDYPTNLDLLLINPSSNEKFDSENQKLNSLTEKVNILLAKKETFKSLINDKLSYLKDYFVSTIELKYFYFKTELEVLTDKKFSSLKNELVATTERKYSFKNEFETSSEEKFSSLIDELAESTERKCSSLTNQLVNKSEGRFSSLLIEITNVLENFKKLFHKELELSEAVERKELREVMNRQIELKEIFHCNCLLKARMLHLNEHKSKKHFLYGLYIRLLTNEKICVGYLNKNESWSYGKLTYDEQEEQLIIHGLSPSTFGSNASAVVSVQDLIECIVSKDVSPFLKIGNQKLIFSLIEDLNSESLQLIKLLIGEGGNSLLGIEASVKGDYSEGGNSILGIEASVKGDYSEGGNSLLGIEASVKEDYSEGGNSLLGIKALGIEASVKEDYSGEKRNDSHEILDFNICDILFPFTLAATSCNYESKEYNTTENNVILRFFNSGIRIQRVSEMKPRVFYKDVLGQLNEHCHVDFKMMINEKVEDSGICFPLHTFKF